MLHQVDLGVVVRKLRDVINRVGEELQVLDENSHRQLVFVVELGEFQRFVDAGLAAHADRHVDVEMVLLVILEENFQLGDAVESREAVEQQRGVVGRCAALLVDILEVIGQVLRVPRVQEPPDDVGRLQVPDGLDVLLNSTGVVRLAVQVVAVLLENAGQPLSIVLVVLGDLHCRVVHVLLVQRAQLALQILLVQMVKNFVRREDVTSSKLHENRANRLDLCCEDDEAIHHVDDG